MNAVHAKLNSSTYLIARHKSWFDRPASRRSYLVRATIDSGS